jgi:hypothetical protein
MLQAAERESAAVGASGAGLLSQSLGDAKVWCSVSGESTAATAPNFFRLSSPVHSSPFLVSGMLPSSMHSFPTTDSVVTVHSPLPFLAGELIESDEASSGAVRYHLLDLQGVDRSQHSHMLVQQLLSLAVCALL